MQPFDRRSAGARRALPALLLVALILGGGAAILPHDVFWHSDEGAKFLQVVNLRLSPDGLAGAIRYPGRAIDPGLGFVPFHPKQYRAGATGAIYLQWPIFFALLTWPFYTLLGLGGLTVLPWAAALAACWLSYRLARAVGAPPGWAWAAVLILGLGTPLGFYSGVFFEHTLAAALVAGAALLLLRGWAAGAWQPLAGAGAALAAAIYLRSELYVLALAGAVLVGGAALVAGARHRPAEARRLGRAALTVAGGLLLALLPLWAYYMISEGDLLPQHALWYFEGAAPSGDAAAAGLQVPALRYLAQAGLGVIPDFLAGPAAPTAPSIPPGTIAALVGGTLAVLTAAVPLRRAQRPAAPLTAAPVWALGLTVAGIALLALAAASVLLSPQDYTSLHGFVLAAPVVVCAVFAVGPGAAPPAARRLAALTGLYVLFHLIVISALSGLGPISRYEWGQRYLLPAYPLLVALAVAGLARLAAWAHPTARPDAAGAEALRLLARLALAGALVLVLIGAGFLVRGWSTLAAGKAEAESWARAVGAVPDPVVLTDRWWLPLVLAPQFYAHTWLLAADPAAATAWPAQAAQSGVTAFSTATFAPDLAAALSAAPHVARVGPPSPPAAGLTIRHVTVSVDDQRQPDK